MKALKSIIKLIKEFFKFFIAFFGISKTITKDLFMKGHAVFLMIKSFKKFNDFVAFFLRLMFETIVISIISELLIVKA